MQIVGALVNIERSKHVGGKCCSYAQNAQEQHLRGFWVCMEMYVGNIVSFHARPEIGN